MKGHGALDPRAKPRQRPIRSFLAATPRNKPWEGTAVDETAWLTLTDPQSMLAFLQESGTATDRKLRLFAAGCCRLIWGLLPNEIARNAVEVVERFADQAAGPEDLSGVWKSVGRMEVHEARAAAVATGGGSDRRGRWVILASAEAAAYAGSPQYLGTHGDKLHPKQCRTRKRKFSKFAMPKARQRMARRP